MRTLLAALTVLLAGCTAAPVGPAESPTTPTGPCTPDTPTPETPAEISAMAWPEPPETRTAESVGSYVASFERAYRHNDRLEPGTRYVETYVSSVTTTVRGDEYLVRLESYTNGGVARSTPDEGTPITVHWDGAPVHVAYLLTDDRLVRAEGDHEMEPSFDAVVDGRTVACV